MGGGSSKNQKVQQFSGPPKEYIPYFTELFKKAQTASNQVSNQPFAGDFYASPNDQQMQGVNSLTGWGQNLQGQNLGQGTIDLGQKTLRGDFLHPESNPYIQGVVNASTRPILDNYTGTILPQLRSQFSSAGSYGGSRQALAEANAGAGVTRNIGDLAAQIYGQNYAAERQNQINAPQMLAQGIDLGQQPGRILAQAGDAQQALQQQMIQNALAKFNEANEAPFRQLIPYSNILNAIPFGTQASTQSQQYGQGLGQVGQGISGALGGASLGSSLGASVAPNTANSGTYGSIIGALLGGLGGAFGG